MGLGWDGGGGGDTVEQPLPVVSQAVTIAPAAPVTPSGALAAPATQPLCDVFDADGMGPVLKLGLRLEEIMWRLHVSRADLVQVLAAYPEVFTSSIHE